MRKVFGRVQAGKYFEKIAVLRGGIGNARVTEKQCEHGAKRRPQNHQRKNAGGFGAVNLFHEQRNHRRGRVAGGDELPPQHHADNGKVDGDVDQRHGDNADDD